MSTIIVLQEHIVVNGRQLVSFSSNSTDPFFKDMEIEVKASLVTISIKHPQNKSVTRIKIPLSNIKAIIEKE
jgi:hypothetical protein